MTTKEIQQAIGKMQVLKFHIVCENITPLFRWEMDLMSLSKSGTMYEFEVKVSRSDFKADGKKRKDYFYAEGTLVDRWAPNYFSYACPDGMIQPEEIPTFAGLYYCNNGAVTEVRAPKRIHKIKHDKSKVVEKILRLTTERIYLGCARLTYENKAARERYNAWIERKEGKE